ncbi:MAG: sigma-70 family RNA polymerase sigma factor [Acidobacteriota bacterium]|nr:sigma-70 family RNA polymerase sigma factor [Acidobacteriota bacterium]
MYASEHVIPTPARPATEDDESALLHRASRGEVEAVQELLARHRDGLFGIAWGYLGDREEALDACQEALAKALAHAHRYNPRQPLSAWLNRILRNCCLDRLRRLKFRRHASLDHAREAYGLEPASGRPGPEENLLRGELRTRLRAALATLREEEREVIILRDVLDWPYARIEAFLGLSHGTLASMIHRARRRLRRQVDAYVAGPSPGKDKEGKRDP